jgi:thymidylate kinase
MIVSFSGLDGAGKTTQISRLRDYLASRGAEVYSLTMYDQVSFSGRLQEWRARAKRVGAGPAPAPRLASPRDRAGFRQDKNVFSWSLLFLRMAVYVFDAVTLRRRLASARGRYDVITCDRFIYDSLANLLSLKNRWWVRAYVRGMLALAPKPDVAVLLDVAPEEAFGRKPEYPLDYAGLRSEAYRAVFSMLPRGRAVFARGGVDEMFGAVRAAVERARP